MPCTPPRTRSSRARTGWSGSARGSGPDRRTPASIPGRPRPPRWAVSWPTGSDAGTPCAAVRRRTVRRRGLVTHAPAAGPAGGTAPVGPGGGLRRVRHRRRPGGAPAAPGLRADQLGCGLGCGDYLPQQQQRRVPGHGGIEQQPDRLFGRRCRSEQHIQQPDQRAGDRVPVEFFAVPVGRGQQSPRPSARRRSHERPARPAAARAPARPAAARAPARQQHRAPAPRQQQHDGTATASTASTTVTPSRLFAPTTPARPAATTIPTPTRRLSDQEPPTTTTRPTSPASSSTPTPKVTVSAPSSHERQLVVSSTSTVRRRRGRGRLRRDAVDVERDRQHPDIPTPTTTAWRRRPGVPARPRARRPRPPPRPAPESGTGTSGSASGAPTSP